MRFARWTFRIAGIYGLFTMIPQYFLESQTGKNYPPPITHPELYYGFIGVTLAWQIAFLVISGDPQRYRLMMLPSIIEKLTFGIATFVLFGQGRVYDVLLFFASTDLLLAVLFSISFLKIRNIPAPN